MSRKKLLVFACLPVVSLIWTWAATATRGRAVHLYLAPQSVLLGASEGQLFLTYATDSWGHHFDRRVHFVECQPDKDAPHPLLSPIATYEAAVSERSWKLALWFVVCVYLCALGLYLLSKHLRGSRSSDV